MNSYIVPLTNRGEEDPLGDGVTLLKKGGGAWDILLLEVGRQVTPEMEDRLQLKVFGRVGKETYLRQRVNGPATICRYATACVCVEGVGIG